MVYGGCLRLLLEAWCTGLGCMSGTARESVAAGACLETLRSGSGFGGGSFLAQARPEEVE